jgi:hypothetical protein
MRKRVLEKIMIFGMLLVFVGTCIVPALSTLITTSEKTHINDTEIKTMQKTELRENQPVCIDDGLVAHWDFNEGSGTIAHDIIGGYDGTLHGATWTDGISGSGVYFDGVNDYIQCDSPVLNIPPYTICVWANASSLPGWATAHLLSNGGQTRNSYGFYFSIEYEDNWQFGVADDGTSLLQVSNSLASTGKWVFLVGIWNGSQTPGSLQLYVNGLPIGTYDSGAWYTGSEDDLRMGAPSNTLAYFFNGILDDVRIYDRVLSGEEIFKLYSSLDFELQSGFGINLIIKNNGTADVSSIDWQITVQGGLLGYINVVKSGMIEKLAPNGSAKVGTGMFLGIGNIQIQMTIMGYNKILNGAQYIVYTKVIS